MEPNEENLNDNQPQPQVFQQPVSALVAPVEPPKTNPNKRNWKLILMVVIVAAVVAGIAVGTTYYVMNQQANNTKATTYKQIASLQTQVTALKKAQATILPTTTLSTTTTTTTNSNAGYIVLSDWGIKFKSPSNLGSDSVTYSKVSDSWYDFSTNSVEAVSATCKLAPIGWIQRFSNTSNLPANVGSFVKKIGAYSYYVGMAASDCSNGSSNVPSQAYPIIHNLLLGVEQE
jgi:archaellin